MIPPLFPLIARHLYGVDCIKIMKVLDGLEQVSRVVQSIHSDRAIVIGHSHPVIVCHAHIPDG
jgi:hypothetical protein